MTREPTVNATALDYPVLDDHRAVLNGLFESVWGLSWDQVQRVFRGSTPVDLKIV